MFEKGGSTWESKEDGSKKRRRRGSSTLFFAHMLLRERARARLSECAGGTSAPCLRVHDYSSRFTRLRQLGRTDLHRGKNPAGVREDGHVVGRCESGEPPTHPTRRSNHFSNEQISLPLSLLCFVPHKCARTTS
eukprot:6195846-Pleurochrysis_carterae.AAC.1